MTVAGSHKRSRIKRPVALLGRARWRTRQVLTQRRAKLPLDGMSGGFGRPVFEGVANAGGVVADPCLSCPERNL